MATKLKNNTQKDTSILPVDVTEMILSRLPVKSLLRFKTVSNSWEATISDPRFAKIFHIQQSKFQNLFFVLGQNPNWRPSLSFSLIKLENQKFRTESVLGIPFEPAVPLCSCNGLVFLRSFIHNVYVLWNPSIRTYIMIPSPHSTDDFPTHVGLYDDPRMENYKVIIFTRKYAFLFSCKSRTWSQLNPAPWSRTALKPLGGVFVDGSFYWWLCSEWRESDKGDLACFDVRETKVPMKSLRQPNGLKAKDTDQVRLTGLTGRLCLYRLNKYRTKLQLWVLERNEPAYSWRQLMKMEKEEPHLYFYEPICLTNEDNILIKLQGSRFVIYNHSEKRFEESWSFSGEILSDVVPCSESLFSPFQNMTPKRKRSACETSAN